ncbi:stage II sporulation protein M [Paenibacillus aurantius]|uniref:Stage II sporulation protein M n=1 Tax=Paenibacillus aurantius TaxID=2918900 RepID=A0AA96REK9_9BACL|nr:stage II sporulation protein M [Paenibacillus aurantius]WNQ10303.1 stage II sporulation protein M [Paenibacillus aurantius]
MDIPSFVKRNRPLWRELEELLPLAEKRSRLKAADIDRLTELYQTASSHLAAMQAAHPGDERTAYLNHLVGRAHNAVYQESARSRGRLSAFYLHRFPQMIGERGPFVLLALFLFVLGGFSGFLAVQADPLNLNSILPPSIAEGIHPEETDQPRGDLHSPLVSTQIMTNNIRVAVLAFLSGVTLGIGTVYLLVYNGVLVGALAAVFLQAGRSYVFWAYILPHGVIELTAIFIAGGAGLFMGYRMFVPGPYSRKYRFQQTAKESALLLLGTLPLFVAAGVIEGYLTPSTLSLEGKYLVAGATLLLLAVYYLYGRYRLDKSAVSA